MLIDDAVFRFTQLMQLGGRERALLEDRLGKHTGILPSSLTLEGLVGDRDAALLVVHDDGDKDVPPLHGRRLAATWPGAQLVSTDGLGHRRILRDPAVVAGAVQFVTAGAPTSATDLRKAMLDAWVAEIESRAPGRRRHGEGVVSPNAKAVRTYEFDARGTDVAKMMAMSGLDYLRGILRGDFPGAPIASTLGFTLAEVDHGRAVFTGVPERFVYNPLGGVHGGWAATLLDSAMGCAVHSTLPAGKGYATVDLSIHLVRGLTDRSGTVRCEAQIVHSGGSIATAQARLVGGDGTLYAHATTTCLVLTPGR